MEALSYRLDQFEGPLDLLLALIQKNKVEITDIPIALICDQYISFINQARQMDMEVASEFLVMASELMLIKSKMLLPKPEEEEKDPRMELADALLRFQQAKQAAAKMQALYAVYSARMVKDSDEISIDKSFVEEQDITDLCAAIRRVIAANAEKPIEKLTFQPMISKPIVPVEVKIVGILGHMKRNKDSRKKNRNTSLKELLSDATSLPDMIAIFLGVLELIKIQQILIVEHEDDFVTLHDTDTEFIINDHPPTIEDSRNHQNEFDTEPTEEQMQIPQESAKKGE